MNIETKQIICECCDKKNLSEHVESRGLFMCKKCKENHCEKCYFKNSETRKKVIESCGYDDFIDTMTNNFNFMYDRYAELLSAICNNKSEYVWKSRKCDDESQQEYMDYREMKIAIIGIELPGGLVALEISDDDYDKFNVRERESSPIAPKFINEPVITEITQLINL